MIQTSLQKNGSVAKHKKAAALQIKDFMSHLPEDFLWKYATTQTLATEWLRQRNFATLFGKLLGARFGSGSGNPALKERELGNIDEFDYQFLSALTDAYAAIFTLIQTGWPYIEEDLQKISQDFPRSEIEYFKELLREDFNGRFTECVEGTKFTVQQFEKEARTLRDAAWRGPKPTDRDIQLLKSQHKKSSRNFYFHFALSTAKKHSKVDSVILNKLTSVKRAVADLADLVLIAARAERSPNPPRRIKSYKFKNGLLYQGVLGGWELVS